MKLASLSLLLSSNGSKKNTSSPNVCSCRKFVAMARNNKANYIIAIVAKEKKLIANLA